MSYEVHVAVAPTAAFFARVHLLAESLRRYGGRASDARIVATVSPDREPSDLARELPWSRRYGIEWRWVDPDLYRDRGLAATALERFRYRFEAPFVIVVDADTICTGRLDQLPESAGEGIAGVIAYLSPARSFAFQDRGPRSAADFWPELYRRAGLPPAPLECEHSGWGLLDVDPDRRHCPPYFNLGVLAGSGEVMNALGQALYDELSVVEGYGKTVFRCQLALTLAIARTGVPWGVLPLRFNFPNHERFWERYPDEAAEVRMMHYLRRHEVDREEFLGDRLGLRAFLERRDLSPVNRLLQSRIAEVAGEIEGTLPARSNARKDGPRFPFTRPALPRPDEWTPFLGLAYRQRRFSNNGPVARRLERALGEHARVQGRHAVLVSSATSGLVAALIALGVRGRVAMPAFTFPATAHAVVLAGCTPVFCDIDEETWELDPEEAARAAETHGCEAILHVRSFGLCRDLDAVERVAAGTGVPLIVDSAAAFGGQDTEGAPVGGAGDVEVFSFHATKVFAVGEGGAVFAPRPLSGRVRSVANFSLADGDVVRPGLNAKLSEFQAAVGMAMLERLDQHVETRRVAARRLVETARTAGAMPPARPGRPPWQCLPLLVPTLERRDSMLTTLRDRGVEARAYYSPGLHRSRAFSRFAEGPLPVTEEIGARIACFPVYSDFTPTELDELDRELRRSLGTKLSAEMIAVADEPL